VTIAALLAALAAVSVVGVFGARLGPDLLAGFHPRATGSMLDGFLRIGDWPIVRSVRLSSRTSEALAASGVEWGPRDVAAAKVILPTIAALFGLVLRQPVLAAAAAVLVIPIPDLAIRHLARRRLAAVDREIPVLLDLLAVATSAGLSPQLAFRRAVDASAGPLGEELRAVINATELGGRWRDELRSAGERLNLPDLKRLLGALTRSKTLGSSLADEVSRLAADVREARRASATERARTAPVKMLFPLVFLVLPAFLLLTVVPVLVTTVRSIA
jgi:pilus assembly protein TadC